MNLRRNSLANLISAGLRFATAIVTTPLLIRVLGVEGYGIWVVLLSALSISVLAELGLCGALSVYLASPREADGSDLSATTLGTTFALLTAIGAAVTAVWFLSVPHLAALLFPTMPDGSNLLTALRVLGLVVLPKMWQNWLINYGMGLSRYDLQARAETASLVALNVGTVVLAWAGYELVVLMVWQLVVTLLTVGYHALLLRRAGATLADWRWSRAHAAVLLRFGWQQWLSMIGQVIFSRADRLVVNAVLGPGAAGLYAAGVSIASKINEISAVTIQPIMQAISRMQAQRDKAGIRRVFERAISINAVTIYALTATIVWTAPWLGDLIVPERATEFHHLLRILAVVYAVYSFSGVGYYAALGLKSPKIASFGILAGAGLTLLAMWHVTPRWGLNAAAWANAGYAITCTSIVVTAHQIGFTTLQLVRKHIPCVISLAACLIGSYLVFLSGRAILLAAVGWALSIVLCCWIDYEDAVGGWKVVRLRMPGLISAGVRAVKF
jgi:O-antigen/teichoic acid export membrane protein